MWLPCWAQIAQQHGIRPQRLLEANSQITNPNLIRPGDEINVPCSGEWACLVCSAAMVLPAARSYPSSLPPYSVRRLQ